MLVCGMYVRKVVNEKGPLSRALLPFNVGNLAFVLFFHSF